MTHESVVIWIFNLASNGKKNVLNKLKSKTRKIFVNNYLCKVQWLYGIYLYITLIIDYNLSQKKQFPHQIYSKIKTFNYLKSNMAIAFNENQF